RVFIKPGYEDCIHQFYSAITQPVKFISIVGEDQFTRSFDIYKYKYVADLSNISDAEDYLAKNFKAKSRYGLRKKIKLIEAMNPEIILNNYDDLDLLIELNKKSFEERSSFNKPHRKEAFHDLLKLDFDIYMLSYIVNGKKEAVSFSIKYNDIYIYINAGVNKKDISNLGTYNIYKNFEKAIEIGSKYLDAGMSDLGWKEKWHLEKMPQYMFSK
ncbi:MAG: GNAT family N-acetyltransferase, partial [Candidatus Pacebacteria bacterium]|nr:GNAT family N-acetyltransferase [Candidatus Paceibacterota bacterium]